MFTVELKADSVTGALDRLQDGLEDMSLAMQRIGEYLAVSTQDRLKTGKSPDGTAFAARSPVTIENYLRRKLSFDGPLYRGGDLYNQIGSDSGPDFAEVGSNMKYAAMMQFGGTKAQFPHLWGNIPARPFLGLSELDETNVVDIIEEYLTQALSTAP